MEITHSSPEAGEGARWVWDEYFQSTGHKTILSLSLSLSLSLFLSLSQAYMRATAYHTLPITVNLVKRVMVNTIKAELVTTAILETSSKMSCHVPMSWTPDGTGRWNSCMTCEDGIKYAPEHSTAQHSTAQHSTAHDSTEQDRKAQDSTAQRSTAQHR